MARLAEEVGFDSLWVGDHLLYRYPDGSTKGPWEAWSLLAALAATTKRVEIGPLVACTAFHSPPMLAKKAATVDEISGGRLILGLGAGWHEPEYNAFGFRYDHRVGRFEEAFTIIRTLLREGEIDFVGQYYSARECELLPRPTRPGGPPLLIGSYGRRMLEITVPHVDAWNVWHAYYGNQPAGLAPLVQRLEDACHDAGRDPDSIIRTAAVLIQLPGGTGRVSASDAQSDTALSGTPEEIADGLHAFTSARMQHLQLVLDPITYESIEAMGRVLELLDAGDPADQARGGWAAS
jgi:alkanesulfonate monooxygenase SsuD/methylene tetrahydromethanopterin reductase-like flavin-dependent oxidoreductase (luciferase family)